MEIMTSFPKFIFQKFPKIYSILLPIMSILLPISLPDSKYFFFWDKQRTQLEILIYGQNKHDRSQNMKAFQAEIEADLDSLVETKILVLDTSDWDEKLNQKLNQTAIFLRQIKRKLKNFKVVILTYKSKENWENSQICDILLSLKLDFLLETEALRKSRICQEIALNYKVENRQVFYLDFKNSTENEYQNFSKILQNLQVNLDLLSIYNGNIGEIKKQLDLSLDLYLTFLTRENILKNQKRVDGRRMDETRQILSQVGVLPHNHGSSLFSRGETQVLNVLTLGTAADAQTLDDMENFEEEEIKNYIHHYNFPSYSVGETGRYFGPGRREIGHGALAEKALLPVLPSVEKFPYTMRLVSECLGSNGSTSMASTCASTLSLLQGGVPITDSVAGVAMGLVLNN